MLCVDLQTGRNHQAWKRTTAKAVGRLSELGEFVLSVVASRSHRKAVGRLSELGTTVRLFSR